MRNLKFSQFLIENELDKNFSLHYFPYKKTWELRTWGGESGAISLTGVKPSQYRKEGYLDIDGVGRHHPILGEALQKLLEQYPELSDYPIKFDGPSMETVQQTLSRVSTEGYEGIPKEWYHGTSTWHFEGMKNTGMRSRGATGVSPSYQMGAAASNPDYVYLMDNDGNAVRFAAREAATKARKEGHDAQALVVRIDGSKLDWRKFRPDEDANQYSTTFSHYEQDWEKSLWGMGAVAYEGEIPSEGIRPHLMIGEDNTWEPVSEGEI